MKEVTLKFREVAVDGEPDKSGEYAVIQSYPLFNRPSSLNFSTVHGLWNTHDDATPEEANETAIRMKEGPHTGEIAYWMPIAEFDSAFKEDAPNAD